MTDVACSLLAQKGWRLPTIEPHDQHLDQNNSTKVVDRKKTKVFTPKTLTPKTSTWTGRRPTLYAGSSVPLIRLVSRLRVRSKTRLEEKAKADGIEEFRTLEVFPETELKRLEPMIKRLTEPGRGLVDITTTTQQFEDMTRSETGPGASNKEHMFNFFLGHAKKLCHTVNGIIISEKKASRPGVNRRRMLILLSELGFGLGVRIEIVNTKYKNNNNNRRHGSDVSEADLGVDALNEKFKRLRQSGYDFVIWTFLFKVGECSPPEEGTSVHDNCSLAARFAISAQKNGLVPIVSVALASTTEPVQDDDPLRLEAFENIMIILMAEMRAHSVLIEFLIIKFQTPANHRGHVELNVGAFGPPTGAAVNPWSTLNTISSHFAGESDERSPRDNNTHKRSSSNQQRMSHSYLKKQNKRKGSDERLDLWGDLENGPELYNPALQAILAQDRSNSNSIKNQSTIPLNICEYYRQRVFPGTSRPDIQPGQVKIKTMRSHRVFTTATAIMRSIPPIIGGLLLSEEDSLDVSMTLLAEFNKMPVSRWAFHVGFCFGRSLEEGVMAKFSEMSVWPPKRLTPVTSSDKLEMAGELFSRNLNMCSAATLGVKESMDKSLWFSGETFQ